MSEDSMKSLTEMKLDAENLYREESYTDLKVGSIRILRPVKTDGSDDSDREMIFTGETQLMTQMGMVPVHCKIDAKNLGEAIDQFPAAVTKAVERMVEEAKEMQRQEASRIVVPGREAGGKIHLG